MNKYERLIEYVINDETEKAASLFHDIVVENSRNIYESLMEDDDIGGDEVDDLISDVESDENGFSENEDGMEDNYSEDDTDSMENDVEDDYSEDDGSDTDGEDLDVSLESVGDALENLVAEFEELMSEKGAEEEFGDEEVEDHMDMDSDLDDESSENDDYAEEVEEDYVGESVYDELDENVVLTKVSKGIANKTEDSSVNKKCINNDNAGKKGVGSAGAPVNFTGSDEKGAGKVSVKDEAYTTQPNLKPVSKKPKMKGEDGSVNKKSVQEGAKRRGRPVGSKNKRRKV